MQSNFSVIEECLGLLEFKYSDFKRLILRVLAVDCVYDPRGYSTGPRHPELVVLELIRLGNKEVCKAIEEIIRDFGVVDVLLFSASANFSPAVNRFLFCLNASLVSLSHYWKNGVFGGPEYSKDYESSVIRYEVDSYVVIISELLEEGLRRDFIVLLEQSLVLHGSLSAGTLDRIKSPKRGFWKELFGA